jgi:hypothetical protein
MVGYCTMLSLVQHGDCRHASWVLVQRSVSLVKQNYLLTSQVIVKCLLLLLPLLLLHWAPVASATRCTAAVGLLYKAWL